MLGKILLILLILSIHSESKILNVTWLKRDGKETIANQRDGLVCVEIKKDLEVDDKFYIFMLAEGKNNKINKTIYYNLSENSCKDNNVVEIDFNDLSTKFESSIKPYINDDSNGFSNQYEIKKTQEKQYYMLMLFMDFEGEKFTIQYIPFDAFTLILLVVIVIGVIIFIVIVVIVVICICVRKKKQQQMQQQYQSSYTAEPIIPEENVVQ